MCKSWAVLNMYLCKQMWMRMETEGLSQALAASYNKELPHTQKTSLRESGLNLSEPQSCTEALLEHGLPGQFQSQDD